MKRPFASTETTTPPLKLNSQVSVVWAKFAAGAMAGLCSAQANNGEWRHGGPETTSAVAAQMADALLLEYLKRL